MTTYLNMPNRRTKMIQRLLLIGALFSSAYSVFGAELPQYADKVHLGVGSCASGVCHGSVRARTSASVAQNEYVIWSRRDRHRISYNTLLTAESKSIAKKMGIGEPHKSDICLDCHADNVAQNLRGKKFQLDDGIGCESCHGGAESYISTHVDADSKRSDNLKAGLYPTDDPRARAKLCLSCHMGTGKKMASHDIMGAGHPRLTFELDTFGALQPAHYQVDEDYRKDKWAGSSIEVWAIGQVESSRQSLRLIRDRLNSEGLFPELALFDCHACHHSMFDKRWKATDRSTLPPGSVRLNDSNFVMVFAIAAVVQPGLDKQIKDGLKRLHTAVAQDKGVKDRIGKLMGLLDQVDGKISGEELVKKSPQLVSMVIKIALAQTRSDYVTAEQSIMAVELLLDASGLRSKYSEWLDDLYNTLADENKFQPGDFYAVMAKGPK